MNSKKTRQTQILAKIRASSRMEEYIAGERILNLLNEPEMSGTQDAPEQGDIIFRNVSFGYNDKYILHDISVTMKQGSLTAIVGPSGSGKVH